MKEKLMSTLCISIILFVAFWWVPPYVLTLFNKPKPIIETPSFCKQELEVMKNVCESQKGDVCRVAQMKYLKCMKEIDKVVTKQILKIRVK